jgi:transposase-like protein
VGWYLRFSLSYRDVEELLAERGLHADHVTVWRWVQRYGQEIQRRLRPRLRPTNDSWRVDETFIRVKGKWVYLYRAVDSSGATIDFLLSAKRDAAAAERFLAKAIKRRVRASQHFRSFWGAWRTIAGYEAIQMIRKGQACCSGAGAEVGLLHRFILGLFAAPN